MSKKHIDFYEDVQMAHDINGTPFLFAAWITSSGSLTEGRIIDHMVFPDESGDVASDYGMEQSSITIEGCKPVNSGCVVLSDRAEFRKENGKDFFRTDGSEWIIGYASSETEALELMRTAIVPGTWPDPRDYDYMNSGDFLSGEDESAFCPAA